MVGGWSLYPAYIRRIKPCRLWSCNKRFELLRLFQCLNVYKKCQLNSGSYIIATCNYAYGQGGTDFPYQNGTVCANCAGKCVNNLCRCDKFCQNDGELGWKILAYV